MCNYMKYFSLRIFLATVLLLGSLMSTSCVSIEMAARRGEEWTRKLSFGDTITYDANGQTIILSCCLENSPDYISAIGKIGAFFTETQQLWYFFNHYDYIIHIISDTCEAVTLDSVTVRNKRGKDIPFHVLNWIPRTRIHDVIMDTISQIPSTLSTGTYKHAGSRKEALTLRIIVDRHYWWVNSLDIDFCLSIRGEQKRYRTQHRKKVFVDCYFRL